MMRSRLCCSKPKRSAASAPSVARPRSHHALWSSKPTSTLGVSGQSSSSSRPILPIQDPVALSVAAHGPNPFLRHCRSPLPAHLAEEDAALELELLADRDHADHRRGAARPDALEGLLGGLLEPDRLEGVLDAAVGQLTDGLDRVDLRRVHRVRRAELLGLREL